MASFGTLPGSVVIALQWLILASSAKRLKMMVFITLAGVGFPQGLVMKIVTTS